MAGYLPGLDTRRPAVPSSTDPENPPPANGLDGDVERQTLTENNAKDNSFCVSGLIFFAIAACIVVLVRYYGPDAHYSVAIDSAMVLDTKPALSFNLTLVVASRSHGAKACTDPGMYVEVFYHGVQVAVTDATTETWQVCARPRNVAELPILAGATMAPVLDDLAEEMGQGVAVFDLRLHIPYVPKLRGGGRCTTSCFSDCKGSRIGGAAVPCGSPQCIYS